MRRERLFVLMSLFLLIFTMLLGRIFFYQVIKGEEISQQAIAMHSQKIELREYNRGDIFDRNLAPLTNSRSSPTAYYLSSLVNRDSKHLDQNFSEDLAKVMTNLLIGRDQQQLIRELEGAEKGAQFVRLATNLSKAEIDRINAARPPGLVIAPTINRYRTDGFCAHLLGYAGKGEGGQGQSGLEKAYDNVLKSSNSKNELISVMDARGKSIPGLGLKLREDGSRDGMVVTTIDKRIQEVVEAAMNKRVEKGAVVVMDIHSKEILAMASRPTFNPYKVSDIVAFDNRSTLTNRALSKYPPGSLFKILLTAGALEEGIVKVDESFNCSGKYVFNDQVAINCWKTGGHGHLTFAQAFANSCNPTFIQVGLRLGRTKLLQYVDKLHLTDENIVGYKPGNIGTYVKIDGGAPALGNASLGQEGVMVTPLQIASLVSTVADDGWWAPPSLVQYTTDSKGKQNILSKGERKQVISSATASKVRGLMEKVVEEGTGKAAAIPETRVAGKTATSQTGRMIKADQEILDTWFAGYFPADQPRWAIVILAEEGSSGAENCAPVFRDISRGILQYF